MDLDRNAYRTFSIGIVLLAFAVGLSAERAFALGPPMLPGGAPPSPFAAVDGDEAPDGGILLCAVGPHRILRKAGDEGCRAWEEEIALPGGGKDGGEDLHPGRPVLVPLPLEAEGGMSVAVSLRDTARRIVVEEVVNADDGAAVEAVLDLLQAQVYPDFPLLRVSADVRMAARFEDGALILEREGELDMPFGAPSSRGLRPWWTIDTPFFVEVPYYAGLVTPVKLLATWNDREGDITIGDFTIRAEGTIDDTGALFSPEFGDVEMLIAGDRARFDFIWARFDNETRPTEDRVYPLTRITVEAFAVVPESFAPPREEAD